MARLLFTDTYAQHVINTTCQIHVLYAVICNNEFERMFHTVLNFELEKSLSFSPPPPLKTIIFFIKQIRPIVILNFIKNFRLFQDLNPGL